MLFQIRGVIPPFFHGQGLTIRMNNKRVLIVDNQSPARNGLAALLNQVPQIEVVGLAANGRESLILIEKLHPDVVLMDIQMPVMDSLEAIRYIKKRWAKVRVIALTLYPSYRADALSVGADEILIKGCETRMLLGAILKQ
jgi:DNA-binding NarL/FixJ family response regulator